MGPTVLFTNLKIILLQYFQFSIFNNKWYPNKPLVFVVFCTIVKTIVNGFHSYLRVMPGIHPLVTAF